GESGFAHGDLLQEHNQYAGRSLNVNGPLYRDAYNVDNVFSMVNIDSGKYEVEVSKKEDNWYEVYGTDNMIKTSMCLSLALNEKAILSMDGYSAGELIFDDGDSCNVEGVYSPVRL
ncbi:hypothetical protein ACW7AU_26940, partial [Klebsiella pneumoniae]|nr:hypothetical protein [Klebsiella pneumoniae]